MGIFKKTVKYSKDSKDLNKKIKNLDEDLKKTGVILEQNDAKIFCEEEKEKENIPKIIDKIEVVREEEKLYNWRETLLEENIKDEILEENYETPSLIRVENYISESNKDLILLRDQVFQEISESTLLNLPEIKDKISRVLEIYDEIQEGLLNEPPETQNEDPLTPLDQNFVTIEELNKHYTLFINRVQEQLATFGGGGETQLKYLDDIVGIATNPSAYDGKFLKYNHSLGKFEFVTVSGGGSGDYASVAGIATYATAAGIATYATTAGVSTYATLSGLSTYASIAGIATYATKTGIATYASTAGIATYSGTSGIATYASTAGIATYATTTGIATYATTAGVSTYATTAGIATYSGTSGIATYASTAGIATYASTAGIATTSTSASTAYGLSGTPNINVGIVTATKYYGDGSSLTGIVASGSGIVIRSSGSTVGTAGTIDFSTNLSVTFASGIATITATGGGGSQTLDQTLGFGNTSSLGMSVGVVTATSLNVTGIATITTGVVTTLRGTNINYTGISTFASTFITNQYVSGVSTISTGIVTTLRGTTLNYTGVSTFTNGPVLIGGGTSTGTASQPLQVTGGVYASGSVGLGTTNPREKLDVVGGNIGIQGIGTSNRFYIQHNVSQNSLDFMFI